MKRLFFSALLAMLAFPLAAKESFQGALTPPAATHASLYSFADVYRLTVIGQAPALLAPGTESPMRVAAAQAAPTSHAQFSIRSVREPQRWALLIAGLLLAVWVARRRMDALL